MLLLIFLLNVVLPFSSASQNVTEAGAYAYGAGNIRDDQFGITILRILKTVGVALGVALVVTFIAPIIIYFLLCCIGFTCSGNNEIIAIPSSPICVLILKQFV
jgi:hypothetical protein